MMKTLLILMSLWTIQPVNPNLPDITPVTRAISNGDVATLATFLDANLELTLLGSQDFYDKAKATQLLSDFFSKNKPKSFSTVHQGSSKGNGSHYTTGDLATSSGTFRIYLYYNSDANKLIIKELRIEKN
jgi:hypothetical protein